MIYGALQNVFVPDAGAISGTLLSLRLVRGPCRVRASVPINVRRYVGPSHGDLLAAVYEDILTAYVWWIGREELGTHEWGELQ